MNVATSRLASRAEALAALAASRRTAQMADAMKIALGTAAALAMLAMSLAFVHLVELSVRQGQAARTASAAHGDALWRCNVLRDKRLRDDCRLASL